MQSPRRRRARSSHRALILGALLIPLNQQWLMHAETINLPVLATLFTIFYNVTFTLFVLVVANAVLQKFAPRAALDSRELLLIYVMLAVATGIFGHDLMMVLVQTIAGAAWYTTPGNDWQNLFLHHIPDWLYITDPRRFL